MIFKLRLGALTLFPTAYPFKIKKKLNFFSKMAEKSNFEKKSPKIYFRQNVRHSVKFQYFEL